MGLFCLSRHLRLLFRSQSRSGGVERVRGCAVVMCVQKSVCELFVMRVYGAKCLICDYGPCNKTPWNRHLKCNL